MTTATLSGRAISAMKRAPALDRLAREGAWTDAMVPDRACAPRRSARIVEWAAT